MDITPRALVIKCFLGAGTSHYDAKDRYIEITTPIIQKNGEESVVKTVSTPHNYRLEVEQLGCCITDGETPYVSEEFTLRNARLMESILALIGYGKIFG